MDIKKKYYETFKEKNKDKINEIHICPICCGSYTYFNKSKHNSSIRHKRMKEKEEQNKI